MPDVGMLQIMLLYPSLVSDFLFGEVLLAVNFASPGPAQVAQAMSMVRTYNPSMAGWCNTSITLPFRTSRCIEVDEGVDLIFKG